MPVATSESPSGFSSVDNLQFTSKPLSQEMLSPGQSSRCNGNVWYGINRVLGVAVYQDQDEVVMLSPLCLVPGKSYFVCPVSVAVTWNKSEAFCQKSEEVLLLSCPQPSTRHHVQDDHQRPWPLYYSTPLFSEATLLTDKK